MDPAAQAVGRERTDLIRETAATWMSEMGVSSRSTRLTINWTGICLPHDARVGQSADGPQTITGNNLFSASIGGRAQSTFNGEPSSAGAGELAISSDGNAYAYSGNDNVPTFLASVPVALGQWHSLAVVADFSTHTSGFYVDDVLLTTFVWEPSEVYTGVLLRGAALAYTAPDTATNKKADYAAHYDQFSIRNVSE